ncbi:MAG TPA: GNAT family N-acetyltransferase [Anaeromyxobacteraceae bacterium]|nr:GNAT family N-acetyltransferase [Anaeromyxobacteraceae bacterium]
MRDITLRKYREADWPFLVSLRRETMRQHLVNSGVVIDEAKDLERVKYRLDCAEIIGIEGRDIGLLKVCRDGDPWELVQIQLAPGHQGTGIGRRLIEAVLSDAREAGVGVKLTVLKANPAKRLYERLGFRVVATTQSSFEMHKNP